MGSSTALPGYDCTLANYGLRRGGLIRLWTMCWQPDSFQDMSWCICTVQSLQHTGPDGFSELATPLVSSRNGLQAQAWPQSSWSCPLYKSTESQAQRWYLSKDVDVFSILIKQSLAREVVTDNSSGILPISRSDIDSLLILAACTVKQPNRAYPSLNIEIARKPACDLQTL